MKKKNGKGGKGNNQRFAFFSRRKIGSPPNGNLVKSISEISSVEGSPAVNNWTSDNDKDTKISDKWLVTNMKKKSSKHLEIKPLNRNMFEYSSFVYPGTRNKNEDGTIIIEDLSFFAVCDGHRNRKAVDFCQENLSSILEKLISSTDGYKDNGERIKCVSSHSVAQEILRASIVNCHEAARNVVFESGCTIVAVWFYRISNKKDDVYFISANAGDARCVLGRYPKLLKSKTETPISHKKSLFTSIRLSRKKENKKSLISDAGKKKRRTLRTFWEQSPKEDVVEKPKITAERLSYDHKASDEKEIKRVQEAGGMIFGGNLECMLQITRGIGDHDFEPGFTAEPHLSPKIKITHELQFLILSSDGIFDVLSDEEAVAIVEEEKLHCGLRKSSIVLGSQAIEKKALDDLSAIIIQLN